MTNDRIALPSWRLDAVEQESMRVWSSALRDDNPIHVDPAAAEALGFGQRTVNPGPANLAYVVNMIAAALPLDYPLTLSARFLGNVVSGDMVEVTGSGDGKGSIHAILRVPQRDEVVVEVDARLEPAE